MARLYVTPIESFEPHTTFCPRCVYRSGSPVVATVVYLGGWMRVERCDNCRWHKVHLAP